MSHTAAHRTAGLLAAIILAITGLTMATTTDAHAAGGYSRPGITPTSKCVNNSEFYRIDKGGKTRAEAEAILDGPGRSAIEPTVNRVAESWHRRLYRGCGGTWDNSVITVVYSNGRVQYAAWLVLFDEPIVTVIEETGA